MTELNTQARNASVNNIFITKWPDMPIVDAPPGWNMHLEVNSSDVLFGEPMDPENCAFAEACKRQFESTHVTFLRSVAYLDLPLSESEATRLGMKEGERVVYRFLLPTASRKLIEEFDQTGEAPEGGYVLKGPTGFQSLAARAVNNSKRKTRPSFGRLVALKPRGKQKDPLTVAGVRYGSGTLKFKRSE